jgi:hypothetical protein
MPFLIDGLILLILGLSIYAEARRGLFFAITDIVRVVVGVALGFAAFSWLYRLSGSHLAGFIGFGIAALIGVFGIRALLHVLRLDPAWGKDPAAKVGGAFLGLLLGCLICGAFTPVIGRAGWGREAVARSVLARPLVRVAPALYYLADALNVDVPMLNARAIEFEDEGRDEEAALVERINYSRLNGSTCIECGTAVHFDGYFPRVGVSVSPKFTCPQCGRTSDGCQTFEGFHRMYGRCPVDVSEALGPIDCGVWPNDRPVYPKGECPIDGKSVAAGN